MALWRIFAWTVISLSVWQRTDAIRNEEAVERACDGKVAIIGAGIGGSAAAFFLHEQLANLNIEIFEKERIGGRTTTLTIDDRVVEMGASIIHNQNLHFKHLAHAANLTLKEPGSGDTERLFSIYDGKKIVFKQSTWDFITLGRMMWRYGLSYFTFKKAPSSMLTRFLQTYELQEGGQAFKTPEEWLLSIGLYNLTQNLMRDEIQRILGTGESATRFGAEIIAGINHVNYNQNNSLNALAGMVSMLPTVDSNVRAISGGNYQLAERLVKLSQAVLYLSEQILAVRKKGSKFMLDAKSRTYGPYDAIILASPLEDNGLRLDVSDLPILPQRRYQQTVTTILRGNLRRGYFGATIAPAGDYILVAEGSGSPFSVISPLTDYKNGTTLYKVFSENPLDDKLQSSLFPGSSKLAQHVWKAYPRESLCLAKIVRATLIATLLDLDMSSYTKGIQEFSRKTSLISQCIEVYYGSKIALGSPIGRNIFRNPEIWNYGRNEHNLDKFDITKFHPPELFAPFELAEGLYYNNAIENAASAMEMSLIAAKNSALLASKHLAKLGLDCTTQCRNSKVIK